MYSELKEKYQLLNQQAHVREWTQYLLDPSYDNVEFPLNSLSVALGNILDANIYVVTTEGKLHGYHETYHVNTGRVDNMIRKKELPYNYVAKLEKIKETTANIPIDDDLTIFPVERRANYEEALTTIVPVRMSGMRLGSIIIAKLNTKLTEEEILVSEHAAALIGIELSFEGSVKEVVDKNRLQQAKVALNALSKSEKRAVEGIFEEIGDRDEVKLTSSEIADKLSITRSIVVNSLQKLVTASIIEQRSMGMKGTYIKVINPHFESLLNKASV